MKQLSPYLLSLVSCLLLSCTRDVYEKGDNENSYLRADFVEAFVDNDKLVRRVVTDDDVELKLTASFSADWIQRADTVYRGVMYYNRQDGVAEVRSLLNVGTLTLRRDTTDGKGWKTDPVGLETVWVSTNRKYLNLGLVLKMGAMEKDAAPQSIGMMLSRVDTDEEGVRTGHLQLVHSQGDVPEYYSQRVYVSLPLQGLTVDTLYLTMNTYGGVVRKGFLLSADR